MEVNKQDGVVPDVIIQLVETDVKLIELIARVRDLSAKYVQSLLRYNVVSFPQMQELTGCSPSYLQQITDGSRSKKGKPTYSLNICYPFPIQDKKSFKFIYRNPKFTSWLEKKTKEDEKRIKDQQGKGKKAVAE